MKRKSWHDKQREADARIAKRIDRALKIAVSIRDDDEFDTRYIDEIREIVDKLTGIRAYYARYDT